MTRLIAGKEIPYMPWTEAETRRLIAGWPQGGMKVCRKLFPERTEGSIKGRAEKLGLRVEGRDAYRRQASTEWIDAQIRREYATGQPKLKHLARRIDRKHGWTKWRAGELGLRQPAGTEPGARWTEAEDRIIAEGVEREQNVSQIQRALRKHGYRRALESIRSRVWRQHGGFSRSYYTVSETAVLFGVSYEQAHQWIVTGKLEARRAPGASMVGFTENSGHYHVTPQAISKFMRRHPHVWNHRRMRKEVLMDFLLGGKAGLRDLTELRAA